MSYRAARRISACVTLALFIIFLIISPFVAPYGEHKHSCCTNCCLVCLTASALSAFKISLRGLLCTVYIFLCTYAYDAVRSVKNFAADSSLVALKTKITS